MGINVQIFLHLRFVKMLAGFLSFCAIKLMVTLLSLTPALATSHDIAKAASPYVIVETPVGWEFHPAVDDAVLLRLMDSTIQGSLEPPDGDAVARKIYRAHVFAVPLPEDAGKKDSTKQKLKTWLDDLAPKNSTLPTAPVVSLVKSEQGLADFVESHDSEVRIYQSPYAGSYVSTFIFAYAGRRNLIAIKAVIDGPGEKNEAVIKLRRLLPLLRFKVNGAAGLSACPDKDT